jgi:hypothetical protein
VLRGILVGGDECDGVEGSRDVVGHEQVVFVGEVIPGDFGIGGVCTDITDKEDIS